MVTRMRLIAGAVALALPVAVWAQDRGASPLTGATESGADKPTTIAGTAKHADPEVERLLALLAGSFRSEAKGERPALRFDSARVQVEGLDNAVYFEVTRVDSPLAPFRQGVFQLLRGKDALRLRVFDFRAGPTFLGAIAGLWAAPEAIPALRLGQLDPNMDLVVAGSGDGVIARTAHAFPTVVGGAVDVTSTVELAAGRIVLHDVGFDASGREVWGAAAEDRTEFVRQVQAPYQRLETQEGLVVIVAKPPEKPDAGLAEGGEVAVQYTGWLSDGTRFDTSRQEGRLPLQIRLPGAVIKGWNEGLKGIGVGERRKLVIPPELGYGERGGARGMIPPNSTLIFDVECVYIDNTAPSVPIPPAGGANPHGGGGH